MDEKQDVWHKEVPVEESAYLWKDDPKLILPKATTKTNSPTLVDLFCGGGGISAGFEMAGFHLILGIDNHKPSIDTLVHNHPNAAAILGDIKNVGEEMICEAISNATGHEKPAVTIVAAGIPCQGFSISNRKRWKDDSRNFLFKEFIRVVDLLAPDFVLIENVEGMRSTDNGSFVEGIRWALKHELQFEYEVEEKLLLTSDYGVPQRRERLVFLGNRIGAPIIWPIKTHGEGTGRKEVTVREAFELLPSLVPHEEKVEYGISAGITHGLGNYAKLMKGDCEKLTNHEAPRHDSKDTLARIKRTKPGEPMYDTFKQRIRLNSDKPSPTVVAGGIRPQWQFGHPWDVRGLSVRERARLMSFPDDFHFPTGMVMGRVITGNAVPPLLAKFIATKIIEARKIAQFRDGLQDWYAANKRDFAWRKSDDPFHVLVAEMLLRKTQAETVQPIWKLLVKKFPTPERMMVADIEVVKEILHPLGLSNKRSTALVALSKEIVQRWLGIVSDSEEKLLELKEVGRYIANATLCFGFRQRRPIVDANVHRIFTRVFSLEPSTELHKAEHIWDFAEATLPKKDFKNHNLALLDFGAIVCRPKNPDCENCFASHCCDYFNGLPA